MLSLAKISKQKSILLVRLISINREYELLLQIAFTVVCEVQGSRSCWTQFRGHCLLLACGCLSNARRGKGPHCPPPHPPPPLWIPGFVLCSVFHSFHPFIFKSFVHLVKNLLKGLSINLLNHSHKRRKILPNAYRKEKDTTPASPCGPSPTLPGATADRTCPPRDTRTTSLFFFMAGDKTDTEISPLGDPRVRPLTS